MPGLVDSPSRLDARIVPRCDLPAVEVGDLRLEVNGVPPFSGGVELDQ